MDKNAQNLNIRTVNINELLEQTLKRLRPIADKKNVEMVMESFRPVSAEIDEMKFTLAISNLVENAIKYNHDNGWVHVSLNADHKYFYIKVEDSGIGIPEKDQPHIFERSTGWTSLIQERSRYRSGTCNCKKCRDRPPRCDQGLQH